MLAFAGSQSMRELDFGARRASEFGHRGFWALFEERHPEERPRRARHGPWFWQRSLPEHSLVISMYVAPEQNLVGVFFGRNEKLGAVDADARLMSYRSAIESRLNIGPEQRFSPGSLGTIWRVNCFAEDNWPAMADWLVTDASRFERVLADLLEPSA